MTDTAALGAHRPAVLVLGPGGTWVYELPSDDL